jgi:hypothetical protein
VILLYLGVSYLSTWSFVAIIIGAFNMSRPPQHSSSIGTSQDNEQDESVPAGSRNTKSTWKEIWRNNKGMFLILIAEIVASSMDAIVRFLQQGGNSMHPFQVGEQLPKPEKPRSQL